MFARLLAIKIVASILLLTGCASAPRSAPRFTTPSTIPIRRAIAVAQDKIKSAQTRVITIQKACPDAKPEIDALSNDLLGAYNELQTSEGARVQLQTELESQVAQANQLATDYDKAGAKITALTESRHGWVKRFWIAALIATAATVLLIKPWRFV